MNEDGLVLTISKWFQDLGYKVDRDKVVGIGQVADVIATKGDDTTIVLEVEAGNHLPSHTFYQARSLRNSAAMQPGFHNAVFVVGTMANVGDDEVERFGKGGVRVMSLGNTKEEFRENLDRVLTK